MEQWLQAAHKGGAAEHRPRKAGGRLRDFAAVACSAARRRGAQTRRAVCGAVSGREGGATAEGAELDATRSGGRAPEGGGCNYLYSAEGRRQAAEGRDRLFLFPPQGFPAKREPQPPPRNNSLSVVVVVVCAVAGWEAGECRRLRRKCGGGLRKQQPAASAAAVPKARPQGGFTSEQVDKANGAPAAAGCESSSLPQAARAHKTN